jgi:quercetin dioxygenase-like cupin family protein
MQTATPATPTVLAPGKGDKYWIVGDHGTFKIGPKETGGRYTVAQTYIPVNAGPPPHMHGREDELFYVLDGTIQFMDNQHTFVGGPGTAVYLPKNIPHTFKNVGDVPVQCILVCLPSGFEAFVAECGQKIDKIPSSLSVDEAAINKLLANCQKYGISILPEHRVLGEKSVAKRNRKLWVLGHLVTIKLTSADTQGNFSVMEGATPPGAFVPPHTHLAMDEFFHVIEGEYEFTVDGRTVKAPAGTFIHVPKGISHGFANKSSRPARLIDFHTPGGFENFFEDCGTVCTDESTPPPPGPVDMDAMMRLFQKHGMTMP